MQPDSRGEAVLTRRDRTNGLPIAREAGRCARFPKSVARLNRCVTCFARLRMKADAIDAEIRVTAAQRRLPAAHLERWLAMDHASRCALLAFARKLRLRTGQLVSALDLLEEIAVRERTTVGEVLGRDEIRRIADAPGSAPA